MTASTSPPPELSPERLAWHRKRFEQHHRMLPPIIVRELFRVIDHMAARERARIAEVLRRESANGDYGDSYTDGLLLAAQLVEALTDENTPGHATLNK